MTKVELNPIQDGPYRGCSRMGEALKPLSLKSVIYLTMIKLDIGIPYLNKIQNVYKLRDAPLEFC